MIDLDLAYAFQADAIAFIEARHLRLVRPSREPIREPVVVRACPH